MAWKISRRKVLKATLASAVVAVQAPFVLRHGLAQSSKQIVISSWGGSFQEALRKTYFEPFTKESGIAVVEQTYGTQGLAKVKAQIEAGGAEVDLLDGPPFWIGVGRKQGLTEEIDLSGIQDQSMQLPNAINKWGYAWGTVSWGVAYSRQSFANGGPASWADFWDAGKFKGRRALFGPLVARHPEYALMADGVAPGEVNPLDDAKIDRAFKKLEEVKPNISIWYQSTAQAETLLESGEVDMAEFVNGRAHGMEDRGVPITFEYNQAVMNLLTWVMAKGAPNRDNALKFLAFCSGAEPQAQFARSLYYGPTNKAALDLIEDDKILKRLPTHPDNLPRQVLLDGVWWGDHLGAVSPRWKTLVSG